MSEMTIGNDHRSVALAQALVQNGEVVVPPHLAIGDRVRMGAAVYELTEKAEGRKRFARIDREGEDTWLTNVDLVLMLVRRELVVVGPTFLNEARSKLWEVPFEARPEVEKRLAWWRHDYVQAFLENRRLGYPRKVDELRRHVHARRSLHEANVMADEKMPSLTAIYEWLEIWDKPGIKSIKRLCFAETSRGVRGVQLHESVRPFVRDALRELWCTSQRHRVRTVWDRVVRKSVEAGVAPENVPCQRTVRRLVKALPPYAAARMRHGARAADHKYRSVGQMVESALPGEVYVADAHKLDWFVVDDRWWLPLGRPWVTAIIDRRTRCIVGLHVHVEPPSSLTIAAALRNAFAPKLYMLERWPDIGRAIKPWGLPNLVILDNALENKATFLIEALQELGVGWHYARELTPEDKFDAERLWGDVARDFSERMPGRTGANVRERGDYDAERMACMTLGEADELLHRWAVNHNMSWHSGIRDVPDRLYLEQAGEVEAMTVEDLGMLDVLLGDFAVRTVGRQGVLLLGNRYGDTREYRPLEYLRTRAGAPDTIRTRVRFDRSDLSRIHVQDPVSREYFPVPSLDPAYTDGLTLAQHRFIRRYAVERASRYVTVADLCRARDDLQRRIDEMTGREPMTERRFATVFRGLGSKGSWGEFFRLADAEYGRRAEDARPVIDLLESEEGWSMEGVAPRRPEPALAQAEPGPEQASEPERVSEPDPESLPRPEPEQAVQSSRSEDTALEPDATEPGESLAARAARLGMRIEGVQPSPPRAGTRTGPAIAAEPEGLAARMARHGMRRI